MHDAFQPGQHVQIAAGHPRRLIFGEYYNFDADGRFIGTAGLADGALGQQAAASTYNLHFGNFGGLPVKLVYFVLGLAVSAVSATGIYIWFAKRRRKGHDEPVLKAAWNAVVWGCPAVLLATFLVRVTLGNAMPFPALFWIGLAIVVTGASVKAAGRFGGNRQGVAEPDYAA